MKHLTRPWTWTDTVLWYDVSSGKGTWDLKLSLLKIGTGGPALLNAVMNLWVTQNAGNFFTSWGTVSFSGRSLLHAVRILGTSIQNLVVWDLCTWTEKKNSQDSRQADPRFEPSISQYTWRALPLRQPRSALYSVDINLFLLLLSSHVVLTGAPLTTICTVTLTFCICTTNVDNELPLNVASLIFATAK
jgi:hypothetical protein